MEHKKPNKARSRSGKVRSACRTCKVRRIKCDEGKPSCSKCIKSGRPCDGYGVQVTSLVQARESSLSSPDIHSYRSEKENRGFDYFRYKALSELIGFDTKSDFWSHVVLRFSEASPAVFRAVLSLSALHETTYCQGSETTMESMTFLRQYNKAIRQLCSRQTIQPVQFTLTCCILFICLENLRGNYDAALLHLEKGLEVLKHWHTQDVTSSEQEAREFITRAFQRLDMQATTFLDSRQPRFNISSLDQASTRITNKPLSFVDLHQARATLEALVSKLFYIITTKSHPQLHSWSAENTYLPARKSLLNGLRVEFLKWKTVFDTFSHQEGQNWQEDELRLSVLLALHHHTTALMLDIRYNTDVDGKYYGPPKDEEWTKINDICQSMISSLSTSKSSFSADMGLIAPLYFTAMQADNPRISQRAIDLLYQIKWKEGFWNAGTAARVAEKALRDQITGASGANSTGGIAELAKVYCVTCC
ncbi:uncharacterized protein LY89DRAFT_584492 [Mollisia scopiformis]|uniref:Zn(2)-C6 fungal-type domain-containing protein n=1 Tax=Mollisia scopiformis TaxID=149040 RepID=A0A194XAW8_MOLSC|nr:uncharacterized protein LY89DRAFT_584492 [Mollisia scopiformis]KUJ17310.1 hypothetical protein LY89DRAFT_584492 [Mollisia scopiformis]